MVLLNLEVFSTHDLFYPYPACVLEASSKDCSTFVHTCGRIYNDFEDLNNNSNFKPPESGFDICQIKQLKIIFLSLMAQPKLKMKY